MVNAKLAVDDFKTGYPEPGSLIVLLSFFLLIAGQSFIIMDGLFTVTVVRFIVTKEFISNDEAHHCYREKPIHDDEGLTGDEKKEAEENNEAARLWISGLEIVNRKLGINHIIDLSATPFFLRGSGYAEGTLFPWTMSDFSLMDAIECGIVKLPR